nr:unnamed protein product [Spirometra erinaceieuropaei]
MMGPVHLTPREKKRVYCSNFVEFQKDLELFYQQDSIDEGPTKDKDLSVNDRIALKTMDQTLCFRDGHHMLALPWRTHPSVLPNNKLCALQRLRLLGKRLVKSEDLLQMYTKTMNDYIESGYAEEVPVKDAAYSWYLPHHPVFHPAKPNRIRVVFDCAAKFYGISLNDQLLSGPDMTNSLIGVLLRFRQEKVAIMADIESMFHQVRVPEIDRDVLRFLWWTNGDLSQPPKEFRMTVHLFGATSSPSCATFALNRAITDSAESYDKDVLEEAKRCFYVDDCLVSVRNENEALRFSQQLRSMLCKGGFKLHKWKSNSVTLMTSIPESEQATTSIELGRRDPAMHLALGVGWDLERDEFRFFVRPMTKQFTRRNILSHVSSFFDPMGYITPVTILAKKVLQNLCKRKVGWDEEICGEEWTLWRKWLNTMPNLEHFSVPRCIRPEEAKQNYDFQLHVFSDASETAYGAVAYMVVGGKSETTLSRLIFSKARIAPIRATSIPRLELMAAVVAVKIARLIRTEMSVKISTIFYCTDSLVVLQSIRNTSKRFPTFFSNRLSLIHDLSSPDEWRYIESRRNPADLLSRGVFADETNKL